MENKYKYGDKIGDCTFLEYSHRNDKWVWFSKFKCECGNEFVSTIWKVKSGHTKSCGCLIKKRNEDRLTTHGMTGSRIYTIWDNMIRRCTNPNNNRYHKYGGRGISVCERWLKFENFHEDMGEPPSSKHTLDRENNDGLYCKDNCRWATQKEQSLNRSTNLLIEHNGEVKPLKTWTDELGLSYSLTYQRIRKLKWNPERALTV